MGSMDSKSSTPDSGRNILLEVPATVPRGEAVQTCYSRTAVHVHHNGISLGLSLVQQDGVPALLHAHVNKQTATAKLYHKTAAVALELAEDGQLLVHNVTPEGKYIEYMCFIPNKNSPAPEQNTEQA